MFRSVPGQLSCLRVQCFCQDFYTILAIQSWQRGPPFLPARTGDGVVAPTVTIDAGEKLGLTSWSRFHPPGEKCLGSCSEQDIGLVAAKRWDNAIR